MDGNGAFSYLRVTYFFYLTLSYLNSCQYGGYCVLQCPSIQLRSFLLVLISSILTGILMLVGKNLHYSVVPKPASGPAVIKAMADYISEHHQKDSGIVYCLSKKVR